MSDSGRFSSLPEPIGPEDWVAEQAVDPVPQAVQNAPDPADRIYGQAGSPITAAKNAAS